MVRIRAYRASDLDALYEICLATADSGGDASRYFDDPKLVGHVYAGPYGVLRPHSALVVEDAEGVGGYIVGAADTSAFESALEAKWWPNLRRIYPDPKDAPPAHLTWDQRMCRHIHHPPRMASAVVEAYPAHLHIDLLPRAQGCGLGRRLMDGWLERMRALGAAGVHLGVGPANARAARFYRRYGFQELDRGPNGLLFGLLL